MRILAVIVKAIGTIWAFVSVVGFVPAIAGIVAIAGHDEAATPEVIHAVMAYLCVTAVGAPFSWLADKMTEWGY